MGDRVAWENGIEAAVDLRRRRTRSPFGKCAREPEGACVATAVRYAIVRVFERLTVGNEN